MPYEHNIPSIAQRIAALRWDENQASLDLRGYAVAKQLLTAAECESVRALYPDAERFRSRIVMDRYNFGRGEYQYFAYPLPPVVQALREAAYPQLASIANTWSERLASSTSPARIWPSTLAELTAQCSDANQTRPTPLLLKYGAGDYNCLHQDLYGELVFPLQLAVLLDRPGVDFEGGQFVLTEQRPRMQSRVEVVPLERGDAVMFAVRERPVRGTRGDYRVQLRHGVSELRSGERHTLGVIFHDAE
jgi:hypothetical protein